MAAMIDRDYEPRSTPICKDCGDFDPCMNKCGCGWCKRHETWVDEEDYMCED